jgi:hypothetical protein
MHLGPSSGKRRFRLPGQAGKAEARTAFLPEGGCSPKEPLKNLFRAQTMTQTADIPAKAMKPTPLNREGSFRSFAVESVGCRVRSSVYGRGSGSKKEALQGGPDSDRTSGGPVVRLSGTCNGTLWSTPGSSHPNGKKASPMTRRLSSLGPSDFGTMMIAGWIHPCPWQRNRRVSRPDSRTTHSTGIASRRGADVQSALQKAFGADSDPFAAVRRKDAMDG